jgi:hypothetical protein
LVALYYFALGSLVTYPLLVAVGSRSSLRRGAAGPVDRETERRLVPAVFSYPFTRPMRGSAWRWTPYPSALTPRSWEFHADHEVVARISPAAGEPQAQEASPVRRTMADRAGLHFAHATEARVGEIFFRDRNGRIHRRAPPDPLRTS